MDNLGLIYKRAAQQANQDGISAGNEDDVICWIRKNCSYREDTEFFLFLGICNELGKIQSNAPDGGK